VLILDDPSRSRPDDQVSLDLVVGLRFDEPDDEQVTSAAMDTVARTPIGRCST
jgi:hypothetical protein